MFRLNGGEVRGTSYCSRVRMGMSASSVRSWDREVEVAVARA